MSHCYDEYYIVSLHGHERYSPFIVHGPHRRDWQKFCDSLLPIAARALIHREDAIGKDCPSLDSDDLINALIMELWKHGYDRIMPDEASYNEWLPSDADRLHVAQDDSYPKSVQRLLISAGKRYIKVWEKYDKREREHQKRMAEIEAEHEKRMAEIEKEK